MENEIKSLENPRERERKMLLLSYPFSLRCGCVRATKRERVRAGENIFPFSDLVLSVVRNKKHLKFFPQRIKKK